ncbi:MAG: hypothetical protein ACNA8L_11530 [Luteolibacter sp.]
MDFLPESRAGLRGEASREPFPRKRRSASAEAALRQELARVEAMTLEERVLAALSLKKRFDWVPRTTGGK